MPTVVLADPDVDRRASDVFALRTSGAEVRDVATLEAALSAVAADAPAVVVLAAELCRAIPPNRLVAALRAQPETAGIRLVLISALDSGVDATGADAVVHRPASPVDLARAVGA